MGKRELLKMLRQEDNVGSSMLRIVDSGTYGEEGLYRSRERHISNCKPA